jgi:hypothetical protein
MIVFDIFRGSAGTSVEIFAPRSATPIRSGSGGIESVSLGNVLATLAVPRPAPGEWIIRKSDPNARVRILSQQFFPRGMLLHPAQSDRLRQCDRTHMAYRVIDAAGTPLEELRDYALSVEITLIRPNGSTTAIPLERDVTRGLSVFQSANETVCNLAGRYWTDVRVTTTNVHGRSLEIFRDRWSGFSVARRELADCGRQAAKPRAALQQKSSTTLPWIAAPLLVGAIVVAAWIRANKS